MHLPHVVYEADPIPQLLIIKCVTVHGTAPKFAEEVRDVDRNIISPGKQPGSGKMQFFGRPSKRLGFAKPV